VLTYKLVTTQVVFVISTGKEAVMADQVLRALLKKLQAVCLFAGDIVPIEGKTSASPFGWRSANKDEFDKTGPTFSSTRVLAAAAVYRMAMSFKVVVSGGKTNVGDLESPPIASVVAHELTILGNTPELDYPGAHGVPRHAIIEEPTAFTSAEQVIQCAKIAREQGWEASRVAILAPCWQFGRITAMLAQMRGIEPFVLGVTPFISMERALAADDEAWNARFVEWYSTPEAREMFAKEALGAGQLWTGHQPRWPNPFRGFTDPLA